MTGGYTTQFRTLFTELQRYVRLQKRYLALDTAEKLVALLSTVAVFLVCFVLGAITLFFFTFALALWIGNMVDNNAGGFLCIGAALMMGLYIFYKNRTSWIIKPIARFVVGLFAQTEADLDSEDTEEEESHE